MPDSGVLKFVDPPEYQAAVHAADLQVTVTGAGVFDAQLTRIRMDHLWMQRARVSLPSITYSATGKDRSMVFLQFDAHQAPILHSGTEVLPGEIVFYPLGSEHHYRTSAAYHCGGMSLAPDDLARFGEMLAECELRSPAALRVLRPPLPLMSRLLNLHKAAGDLASTAPDILVHPEVARSLEQALVRAMVECLTDPATQDRRHSTRLRVAVMQRFEEMLEAHSDEPLHVMDICAGIGVSERTLRLHCQEQLGMSPHRYLWLRRMNLVKQALANANPVARTVTEIANNYGFAELGRFAVSYRRLFGESPSVTLRRPLS
jgi:AraC-like DNA-binding protein